MERLRPSGWSAEAATYGAYGAAASDGLVGSGLVGAPGCLGPPGGLRPSAGIVHSLAGLITGEDHLLRGCWIAKKSTTALFRKEEGL